MIMLMAGNFDDVRQRLTFLYIAPRRRLSLFSLVVSSRAPGHDLRKNDASARDA